MITFTSLTGELHIQSANEVAAISEAPPSAGPAKTLIFLSCNPNPFRVMERKKKVLFLLNKDDLHDWRSDKPLPGNALEYNPSEEDDSK